MTVCRVVTAAGYLTVLTGPACAGISPKWNEIHAAVHCVAAPKLATDGGPQCAWPFASAVSCAGLAPAWVASPAMARRANAEWA